MTVQRSNPAWTAPCMGLPMQVPLFVVPIQYEDGRTNEWPLSPLSVAAMSLGMSSNLNPGVVQALQHVLLPGMYANAAVLPAMECAYQHLERAVTGGGSTRRCDDLRKGLSKDALLRASNVTNIVGAFHQLVPERTPLMAGAALACLFIPLCMLMSVPVAPIGSIVFTVYGAYKGGLQMLFGPIFFFGVLAVAYALFMPDPPPKKKATVKSKTS